MHVSYINKLDKSRDQELHIAGLCRIIICILIFWDLVASFTFSQAIIVSFSFVAFDKKLLIEIFRKLLTTFERRCKLITSTEEILQQRCDTNTCCRTT